MFQRSGSVPRDMAPVCADERRFQVLSSNVSFKAATVRGESSHLLSTDSFSLFSRSKKKKKQQHLKKKS